MSPLPPPPQPPSEIRATGQHSCSMQRWGTNQVYCALYIFLLCPGKGFARALCIVGCMACIVHCAATPAKAALCIAEPPQPLHCTRSR